MPAVLVHGVPDTERLWNPVRARLARSDMIALTLPGFGVARPAGFAATKEAYVDWLIAELERVGVPVDLVGHDWGSMLVQRVASVRPDLIRTWTCGAGAIDADYEWHEVAKQWQTPGLGEDLMALTTPEALAEGLAAAGIPADIAPVTASLCDDTMKDCILRLYRSAVHVGLEWQSDAGKARPALVIWGAEDPYAGPLWGERLAARVGGRSLVLEGCGHWWPLQRPAEVAAALEQHWRLE